MTAMTQYAGLAGRTALVTGAGRGLGRVVVLRLLEHGSSVVAVDIDADALSTLASEAGAQASIRVLTTDLGDAAAAEALVPSTVEAFGGIDVLVNNAAILTRKPLEDVTIEDFDRVIAVNLRAPFLLARAALGEMRRQRWGRIINISSIAARTGGSSNIYPYVASKGGLIALTKALAKSAAPDNVLVSAVLPAGMDTPMVTQGFDPATIEQIKSQIPIGRLSRPEEIAEAVLWLASEASSYVTGACFDINGGWAMT
jgi:NAD(P)-dependent dehydrogenase (short-subunit alcohol dehydrogenase family)